MWHSVAKYVVPDVLKDFCAFISVYFVLILMSILMLNNDSVA